MSTGAVSKMSKTEVESTVAIKQKNGRFRGFLQRLFPRFTNTGLVFGALFFLASFLTLGSMMFGNCLAIIRIGLVFLYAFSNSTTVLFAFTAYLTVFTLIAVVTIWYRQ